MGTEGGNWKAKAACLGMPTKLFYSLAEDCIATVKATCDACPVREQCLAEAVANDEHGIWGGLTEKERKRGRRTRRRPHDREVVPMPAGQPKYCPKCRTWLDQAAFISDRSRRSGLSVWCRDCLNSARRSRREERRRQEQQRKAS